MPDIYAVRLAYQCEHRLNRSNLRYTIVWHNDQPNTLGDNLGTIARYGNHAQTRTKQLGNLTYQPLLNIVIGKPLNRPKEFGPIASTCWHCSISQYMIQDRNHFIGKKPGINFKQFPRT